MPTLRLRLSPPILAAGIALLAGGCSSTQTLQSAPAAPVTVDGSEADWQGALQPVEGRSGLVMGTRTDGEALYVIAVLRGEQPVRQAVAGGLTLWLDPDGGKDRALGVRFPLGIGGGGPGARGGATGDTDALQGRFASATQDLEVLRDEAETGSRLPASSATGLRAAASLDRDVLVVEYRVPLAEGAVALGASPGATVGLGLTTPEIQRPEGERQAGRRPGGGRGGASGGGRGQGGGRRGGARAGGDQANRPSPLDVWVRVELTPSSTG